jgi:hypothetical protein
MINIPKDPPPTQLLRKHTTKHRSHTTRNSPTPNQQNHSSHSIFSKRCGERHIPNPLHTPQHQTPLPHPKKITNSNSNLHPSISLRPNPSPKIKTYQLHAPTPRNALQRPSRHQNPHTPRTSTNCTRTKEPARTNQQ